MSEDKLIDLSNKAGDEYAKLGNKLDIALEALRMIINCCNGENETHADFYHIASKALGEITGIKM